MNQCLKMGCLPFWKAEESVEEASNAFDIELKYECKTKEKECSLSFPFLWPQSIPSCMKMETHKLGLENFITF